MHRQNRVTPLGLFEAVPARGLLDILTWALSSTSPAERAARVRLGLTAA